MSEAPAVGDDEVVMRHIPAGTTWQAPGPPPRLTSANFRTRAHKGETYLSVSRTGLTTPEQLLKRVGGDVAAGSRIACATVGEIRKLGFEVLPEPIVPDDPGHAGIHPTAAANFDDKELVKRLAVLFRYRDDTSKPAG
jgi:hypothetical protein